ncbi:T-complex protein 1 subunit theta-like [Amphibalanus amphitrite]|uniref:T-complex protein 1 subunit theta-like n=1 Tax=Amphibalanus amphitrite TaxID=1232801 RepID=UPI001C91EB7A|nr:T-complex protein 1 subunit theta-like [Amphibalanus amphitrite]XP_043243121.1 T-complex protein 1 subunit theta-like [Amphibalanus amphitrite]
MALHVPRAPGFGQMLKEGSRHFSGLEEAVYRNIHACKEFADTVKTAYGPRGMNKMVINHIEKLFVTSDAATIIRELEVEHPAAKMMILSSQMQEQEVGDGTNFVLIMAGALLASAEDLLRMGLTPTEVVEGYELALKKALELLPGLVCGEIKDLQSESELKRAIKPSVMSKQYGNEDFITDLVVKACMSILPEKSTAFSVDNVRVSKILGAGLLSSQVVQGMVFRREAEGTINTAEKAKVAVFTCPVDIAATETKGTVLIKTAQELKDFSRGEESQLEEQIKAIAATGAKVIVAGGKFGDMALHYVNKYNLMAVRLLSKFDLRRLCKTVGATALPRLTPPSADELGYCDRVYADELGETAVVVFKQEAAESRIATVVVRGATDNMMDDVERSIDDGINNFKALTKDGRLLPGAGACEMELAHLVSQYADTCPGLEQYAIKRFAAALEAFPKVLADNSGCKATEVLSRLYAAHQEGKKTAGFNVEGEGSDTTLDAAEAGIFDLWLTKHWALKYAATAACTVLKVDQIIMAKRAGGPKPRENKDWDED